MSTRKHRLVRNLAIALRFSMVSQAVAQESLGERIDLFVRAERERQKVPGVAIGVVWKGKVLKAAGYGSANLEHQVPVRPETIFQSGSVGKQFTAVAVMLQVEDAKLSITDPLTKFFPNAPKAWRAITVYHLLTHTSGIPDYADGDLDYRKDYDEAALARVAFGLELEFPAGTRWSYSNTGYMLLGIIVRKVSGSFYGDVLAKRVFKPLDMKTARIISEAEIVPNRAAGYEIEDGTLRNQSWVSPTLNTTADGALYVSVLDMIAWDKGVRAKAILKQASWDLIFKPALLKSGKTYPYGLGWFLEQRGGQPLHQHGGTWQGFTSQFSRFIGANLSVIVLTNSAAAEPEQFADGIAAILNPKFAAQDSQESE